ncbi:MAG: ribulose-phosphate 3-epimerase [Verrucomicrobiae bacterium]|nr:ribulose-phosphate 3-epimerase [Verrucomicrobiae bacterium]
MASLVIAPSLLAADYTRLGDEVHRAEKGGADWLHVDVMDGHFVPNLTFGPGLVAAIRKITNLPLDVHLMIERPDRYVDAFCRAGAHYLTVHAEAPHVMMDTLRRIRDLGVKPGVVLNPSTPAQTVESCLPLVDVVLCMTVVPGFGGQSFMPGVMEKVRWLADHPARKTNPYWVEVDGGVNRETARQCVAAGANALVAGTALFGAPDFAAEAAAMRKG